MKRIIIEVKLPEATTIDINGNVIPNTSASITTLPILSKSVAFNGKYYLDYIDETNNSAPSNAIYVGEMQADGTVKSIISTGIENTFPHCFLGWDKKPKTENPVIELPRHIVFMMLKKAGLLPQVEVIVAAMAKVDANVKIAYDHFPTAKSNDTFVNLVLGENGLKLTSEQIYTLFSDAAELLKL